MGFTLRVTILLVFWCASCSALEIGELRLKVTGPNGSPTRCDVLLQNGAKDLRRIVQTAEDGTIAIKGLPTGRYRLVVSAPALSTYSEEIDINSALPVRRDIQLTLVTVRSTVDVRAEDDE